MSDAFRSSDDFDEQAHQLYNEGRYDDALTVLREGLVLYPHAVELQVGLGYAYLAREDIAWARRAFEAALALDPDHEDGLAGMGETLLRLGNRAGAIRAFERILDLGFSDDHDLMLQVGRSLFREGLTGPAHRFFELASQVHPDSSDAAASIGYAAHRLGREGDALYWLRRALALESDFAEARIYLANMLYDRGESDAALHHLERTRPEDHFDELALWRVIELKRSVYRLPDDDPELEPWMSRLEQITAEPDALEMLLAEVEAQQPDGSLRDPTQLELFAALLTDPHAPRRPPNGGVHEVMTLAGTLLRGTWDEILQQMKDAEREWQTASLSEFMLGHARRGQTETGVVIPVTSPEAFVRGSAAAGVIRIVS